MKILVLGPSGMLGHMMVAKLAECPEYDLVVAGRSLPNYRNNVFFSKIKFISNIDAENTDSVVRLFSKTRFDCVINCIGLIKQRGNAGDVVLSVKLNALFPHLLAHLCSISGARLIHISTDCVFSGRRGNYVETDIADSEDLYGRTKYLGELISGPNSITLRTSIIGHELSGCSGLVEWFLAQEGQAQGYKSAFFSGLPTVEFCSIIIEHVLPNHGLSGVYNIASSPISKFDLLSLISYKYQKIIEIIPDFSISLNRSLDGSRFASATGYIAPSWERLIEKMHQSRVYEEKYFGEIFIQP